MSSFLEKVTEKIVAGIHSEQAKPMIVCVMGQTGVGKSSLINALFGTSLNVSDVKPCTKEPERVEVKGISGASLHFYDLPGLGESVSADLTYLDYYYNLLNKCDIALWLIHSDSRALSVDRMLLGKLLERFDNPRILSKVTFVLSKCDLVSKEPWVFGLDGDCGVFAASDKTERLLLSKEKFVQEEMYSSFGDSMKTQVRGRHHEFLAESCFFQEGENMFFRGVMDYNTRDTLIARYPNHAEAVKLVFSHFDVVSCSSMFRFNLARLMLSILTKLSESSVLRFKQFVNESQMSNISYGAAKSFRNIQVFDIRKNTQVKM